jgi:hypothetical protein
MPVLLTLAALIVGIAALLPLVQSSGVTTTAGQIRLLEQERAGWQARLRELEVQIAEMGSLNRIEREAKLRFKMTKPERVHYLTVDAPPPEERRLPSHFLPAEPAHRETGSSLWDDIFGWFPLP